MKLQNIIGDQLCLEILGYQFPDILDQYWDSNWLNVRMIGGNLAGGWMFNDPFLLTFEIDRLASWLEKIPAAKSSNLRISFTEPSLRFRLTKYKNQRHWLEVDLGYAFRKRIPDVFRKHRTIQFYFRVTDLDLFYQAYLLREQLKKYPQRVFR